MDYCVSQTFYKTDVRSLAQALTCIKMIWAVWFLKYRNSMELESLSVPFIFHRLRDNLSMSKFVHCVHRCLCAIMLLKIALCYSACKSLKQEIRWLPTGKNIFTSKLIISVSYPCLLLASNCICDVKKGITIFSLSIK